MPTTHAISTTTPLITARWWPATRPHLIVIVFILAAWGTDLVRRVSAWLTGEMPASSTLTAVEAWAYFACHLAFAAGLAWFAVGAADLGLTRSVLGDWSTWIHCYGLGALATLLGLVVGNIAIAVTGTEAPTISDGSAEFVAHTITAGPAEELAVAAMIVLMQRARWWTTAIYVTIIALRATYHLHYGLPVALSLSVWTAGFVYLLLRYRNVVALAGAHLTYNFSGLIFA